MPEVQLRPPAKRNHLKAGAGSIAMQCTPIPKTHSQDMVPTQLPAFIKSQTHSDHLLPEPQRLSSTFR